MVLGAAVGALEALKKPFSIAAGAQKTSCPTLLIQKGKIRLAATNRAVLASLLLLVYKAKQVFRVVNTIR